MPTKFHGSMTLATLKSVLSDLKDLQYMLITKNDVGLSVHYSSCFTENDKNKVVSMLSHHSSEYGDGDETFNDHTTCKPRLRVTNDPTNDPTSSKHFTESTSDLTPRVSTSVSIVPALKNMKLLTLGTDQLLCHYRNAFTSLSQVVCKAVAKIWIKVAEPNKQAVHPYKHFNSSKPLWWPRDVDHIEPDHLDKHGRVEVMISILRNKNFSIEVMRLKTSAIDVKAKGVGIVVDKILSELYYVAIFDRKRRYGNLSDYLIDIVVSNFELGKRNGSEVVMLSKIPQSALNYVEYPVGTHLESNSRSLPLFKSNKIEKVKRSKAKVKQNKAKMKAKVDIDDEVLYKTLYRYNIQNDLVVYDPFLIYIEGYTSSSESTEF